MDSLSAFSVACGVAQMISFAMELVSAGNEIYNASDGVLIGNKATEDAARDLKDLTQELSKTQAQRLVGQTLEPDEWRLRIISDNCSSIASELAARLDKLKVQGKHRRWKSYRQALMSVWQKDDIDKISARLETYHKELDTRILFGLRKRLDHVDLQSSEQYKALDDRAKEVIKTVLQSSDKVDDQLTSQANVLAEILTGQDRLLTLMTERSKSTELPPSYTSVNPARERTDLHEAAEKGDVSEVRQILRFDRADVNAKDAYGCTALHLARSSEIAKRILNDKRVNQDAEDNEGRTALVYAVLTRRPDVVKVLLEAGVDKSIADDHGRNAAFYAVDCPAAAWLLENCPGKENMDDAGLFHMAWLGDIAGVEFFISQRGDVNSRKHWGGTALTAAARHGSVEVCELLLKHHADIELPSNEEWTPLLQAVRESRLEVVKLLLKHGAKVGARLKSGNNALAEACKRGDFDIARLLIEAGSRFDDLDSDKQTPLLRATFQGHTEFVRYLLSKGVNAQAMDAARNMPVHLAAEYGHTEVLKALLEHGVNTQAKNKGNHTPLTKASQRGRYACVELLLDFKAEINAQGDYGHTALAEAAHHGHADIVRLLLSRGAQLEIPKTDGFTPIWIAASLGRAEVIRLLAEAGANIEAIGSIKFDQNWKTTPLMRAASKGHVDAIAVLAELGADLEADDENGKTSLIHAVEKGHADSVASLIQKGANVNAKAKDGTTPLEAAAFAGSEKIVEILLRSGASLRNRNQKGCTPWIVAVHRGHDKRLQHLLNPVQAKDDAKSETELHPSVLAAELNRAFP